MGNFIKLPDEYDRTPLLNETITVSNVAKSLTSETYSGAQGANIFVEDAPIRMWVNGVSPTNTVGILIGIGGSVELGSLAELQGFKAIATTSADAKLQVTYWR